ncbi:MAG: arginine deiminase family protein [Mangrovibacterium sp.]
MITIAGSELARGGGGARCMTMPFRRKEINR